MQTIIFEYLLLTVFLIGCSSCQNQVKSASSSADFATPQLEDKTVMSGFRQGENAGKTQPID